MAFNPSTFGEPLDAVFHLQERTYPTQKVSIVLPFLDDGVLELGGTKAEGIFRMPGDSDAVTSLKMRLDRGAYTLEGVDDSHVPASGVYWGSTSPQLGVVNKRLLVSASKYW